MPDGQRKTETKSVQAFRGMEARTISKWEGEGWHLATRTPGKFRTELTFERERPQLPKKTITGVAIAVVVLAVIFTIGIISERNDPTAAAPASTAATPASSAASATSPNTQTPSESPEAGPLTIKNNRDLAALVKLGDNCEDSVGQFADKYADQTIQFDGAVAAIAPADKYQTRYDILIVPGEADDNTQYGPTFQYRDVNLTSDLGWTGSNVPDSLSVKTKLLLTATVGQYNAKTCLFQLDPLATSTR